MITFTMKVFALKKIVIIFRQKTMVKNGKLSRSKLDQKPHLVVPVVPRVGKYGLASGRPSCAHLQVDQNSEPVLKDSAGKCWR